MEQSSVDMPFADRLGNHQQQLPTKQRFHIHCLRRDLPRIPENAGVSRSKETEQAMSPVTQGGHLGCLLSARIIQTERDKRERR